MLTEKDLDELIAECDLPPLLEWQRIMLLKLLNTPDSVWYEQRKFARGNGYSQTMAYYDLIRFCLLEKLKLKEKENADS